MTLKKLFTICVFTLLALLPFLAQALDVNTIRVGQHGERTRIVLETNRDVAPSVFTLPTPNRVVLDLPVTEFKTSLSSVELPEGSLVSGMRAGLFQPTVSRMVLDVTRPVEVNVFGLEATKTRPFRLVVDLTPAKHSVVSGKPVPQITAPAPHTQTPVPPAHALPEKDGRIVVVIDPGHGGVDPGAVGYSKTYEKHVALAVSKKLRDELEKIPNVDVYMPRDRDIFVKLEDRVRKAQHRRADVFVSVHADAHRSRSVRGGSVYTLSERASDKEAARLARHANEGDLVAGVDMSHESPDVRDILIELAQRETMNRSNELAADVLKEMGKVVRLRKDTPQFAGFRVLKAPEVPSILVELSYMSNKTDERILRDKNHQQQLARAIKRGVETYLQRYF